MQEDPVPIIDPLGMNDLQDRLKAFCRDQGLKAPRFWIFPPDGYYICHAVSLHLNGRDRWEELDTHQVEKSKSAEHPTLALCKTP